ncbi:MAG: glycogen synthase GlgA [Oscillospiraceae bacterium]|jgi:starch synthase|nr:glycogen synthase GlgA [Oscillospiraceae bacterium]
MMKNGDQVQEQAKDSVAPAALKPVRAKRPRQTKTAPKPERLSVLFAAAEAAPFIKTGGLADVIGALPRALAAEGIDARVILPLYGQISNEYTGRMRHVIDFEVEMGWRRQYCGIEALEYQGVVCYFVDNRFYFNRPYVYGGGGDEHERYGFFCRAALNALPLIGFQPRVVHCHDWQAGMIPALLSIQYRHLPFYANARSIMTIHNLQYQGIFNRKSVQDVLGLGDSLFTADKLEYYGCANYLKSGLVYADLITTVSPSYADEIQTMYFGERLDGLLRARRSSLHGVINGIDTEQFDPANGVKDGLAAPFSAGDLSGKALCKAALQNELQLAQDPKAPLVAMVTRLNSQKGLDLVDRVVTEMMDLGIQLVVLGQGDAKYTDLFSWAESQWRGRVGARYEMNGALAKRIYAGADIFLMPSLFEPCGLSQMIAMRYGTVPVVRETGGLRDTVLSYNESTDEGNGFTFFSYNAHDMLHTLARAVDFYSNQQLVWRRLAQRGMETDFSWGRSAKEYARLYEQASGG